MSFQFFPQRDMMDCGAACLQSICCYYGKKIAQQYIRELCHITKNGVSMLGIADAAEALGFKTIGIKLNWDKLSSEIDCPCIIHWNQQHFVVVVSIKKNKIRIMDPAVGLLSYRKSDFLKSWLHIQDKQTGENLGAALLLYPTSTFYNQNYDFQNKLSFSVMLQVLNPFKIAILRLFICMLFGCIISLIFPYLTQKIVDTGIKNADIGYVSLILIAEFSLLFGQIINDIIKSQIMLRVTTKLSINLISDFLRRLMKLPIRFFDTKHIGDILQRIKDFNRIESFLTSTLLSLVFAAITFLVYGVMMLSFSYTILLTFISGSILYVCWVTMFLKKRKKLDYMQFQYLACNHGNIIQIVNGMQEIKLNSCEQSKRWEWEQLQHRIYKLKSYSLRLANIQGTGSSMIDESKNLIIVFLAAQGVISGYLTIGELVAIQYIIGQLNAPLHQFVSFLQALQDAKISMERMQEIQNTPEEECLNQHIPNPKLSHMPIILKNVSFQYDGPRSRKVLDNVNITIKPNSITAIVGMSGSGKTTLLKLLLSFFLPSEGNIYIGETPLENISPKLWRKLCGVVMQDGFIFSDTIENNIALSDIEPNIDKVVTSAKLANIHEYIMSLPMRYNTRIGAEGQGLSSGQKQRLLIARAIYKDPSYIFLDEATNSLDTENEHVIVENLENFYNGRTVVVVAHRLSTVRNADQIIVLNNGSVIETGNHESLIKKKGAYYNLIKNQLDLAN